MQCHSNNKNLRGKTMQPIFQGLLFARVVPHFAALLEKMQLSKDRLYFKLLTGLNCHIVACRPNLVIDQRLENDGALHHPDPSPRFAVNARQWNPPFPSQSAAVPAQEHRIAKTDIQFYVDDRISAPRQTCGDRCGRASGRGVWRRDSGG
jgi:hypothetical protein